ncbi:YcaO-like family protein [Actinomadura opuntiae]|uniref:YcaO-like family protein n=1 Tax=Actinomadura sp. OS1-43 TaxID=604315 RepID=UPI00255B14E3|nr:YcaO-like family protein [Actinomadura sp. OS1-43]MDL4816550.1 YcaO-like family protein [Actinomadura sp. OS1-43]
MPTPEQTGPSCQGFGGTVPPGETFLRFRHLMEPLGITRLANITGLDSVGVPVYLAIRPLARSLVVSVGKGTAPEAAKTAALMESIETWHAEQPLPGRSRVSPRQVRERGLVTVDLEGIPLAVDGATVWSGGADEAIDWVGGEDLLAGERVLVPYDIVSMDFTRSPQTGLARNSNGLASGNSAAEATVHGLCEIIERDAETRWRASEDARRVDLATIDSPAVIGLLELLSGAGLTTVVWDVTSAVGIACFGCVVLADPDTELWCPVGVHDGFACHPSPERALFGAIIEAVQKRLTYISGSRDDIDRAEMARAASPELHAAVWEEISSSAGRHDFGQVADRSTGAAESDVHVVVDALRRAGAEQVTVVDLSTAHGVPVTKSVVPGLEGPFGMCRPLADG